jgi:hypothetical protein
MAMVVHGGIWAAVGAAGGLALGVGLGGGRRIGRAALGGLLGAVAAAVIYIVIGGLAFPLSATHRPIALTWATRLLARLLVTSLAAAGAVWVVQAGQRPPAAAPPGSA